MDPSSLGRILDKIPTEDKIILAAEKNDKVLNAEEVMDIVGSVMEDLPLELCNQEVISAIELAIEETQQCLGVK